MHLRGTVLYVLALGVGGLVPAHIAYGQAAACCLADQCEELEEAPCADAGGTWLGGLDPPVLD